MPLRKKTIRNLPPLTRRLATLHNDLYSLQRRLKNLLHDAAEVEALAKGRLSLAQRPPVDKRAETP